MVKVPGSTTCFMSAVPQRQVIRIEREGDRPPLAGLEGHALESLQLDHRPGDARLVVVDVELDDLVAGPAAGVARRRPRYAADWLAAIVGVSMRGARDRRSCV